MAYVRCFVALAPARVQLRRRHASFDIQLRLTGILHTLENTTIYVLQGPNSAHESRLAAARARLHLN